MKLVAFVATAALAVAPSLFADDALKAEIPFPFQVEAKSMPAGMYDLRVDVESGAVEVKGGSPSTTATALVMTRLGAHPHPDAKPHPHLVFDKVGDTYTLSELWLPGADGFLLHATKGEHEHRVIHVR